MNLTEFIACAKFKNKGNSGLSENQISNTLSDEESTQSEMLQRIPEW